MLKQAGTVLKVAGVLLLAGLAFQTWRVSGLKERIAEDRIVMDSLRYKVAVADSMAAVIDSAAIERIGELDEEIDSLENKLTTTTQQSRRVQRELDEVVATLEPQVQERVKLAVDAVQAAHEEEVRSLSEILAAEREKNSLLDMRLTAQIDLNRVLREALEEANEQLEFYQTQSVSLFSFNLKADALKLGLAFVGGYVASEVIN